MVRWVCVRPCLLLHPGLEIPGATAAVILTRVADSNLTHPLGWPSGNRRGPNGLGRDGIGDPGIATGTAKGYARSRGMRGELALHGAALFA